MAPEKPARRTMKALIKEYKADRVKNANIIVDVMQRLESNESGTVTSAITGLHQIFTLVLNKEDIQLPQEKMAESLQSASEKFSVWLREKYNETLTNLRKLLSHEDKGVQELALCCLVKLMQSEGCHPIQRISAIKDGVYYFPKQQLEKLISVLVVDDVDNQHLISLLSEYLQCQDFMFFTLLSLSQVVKKQKGKNITETFIANLFLFLEQIDLPEEGTKSLLSPKLLLCPDTGEKSPDGEDAASPAFVLPYAAARRALNTVWQEMMTYPLTPDLYTRSLILLPEKVMMHLNDPLCLTGFFMEAYNLGGAISLMALQGVFILINKHNLEYPDFYTKLYALLEPTVFHARYRPRFFMLLDRFLSSSHLPEYVMAAFTKRLSRLSLVAPTQCLALLIKFIANLLIRCQGLHKLLHNPTSTNLDNDPYDPNEKEPSKCRANESSLWEVATLQNHALPYVAKAAGFINRNLPMVEYDISEYVENTYDEIFERNCKLMVRDNVPTTFHKPQGLFAYNDDHMSSNWSLV